MNEFDTNARLRSLIRETLEMPENTVRPSHQNAPIYKGEEYITVQILSEVAEGTDNTHLFGIEGEKLFGEERLWGQRLMSANIQYFNGDAMKQLRRLATRFQSIVGVDRFEEAGFGFVRSTITDLTGLLPDEMWQTRAVMRLDFYAVVRDHVKTPLIVQVPLTTYTAHNTTEQVVPIGGELHVKTGTAPPFLVYETAGGETVALSEVKP